MNYIRQITDWLKELCTKHGLILYTYFYGGYPLWCKTGVFRGIDDICIIIIKSDHILINDFNLSGDAHSIYYADPDKFNEDYVYNTISKIEKSVDEKRVGERTSHA